MLSPGVKKRERYEKGRKKHEIGNDASYVVRFRKVAEQWKAKAGKMGEGREDG